jgi:hypothetical protein
MQWTGKRVQIAGVLALLVACAYGLSAPKFPSGISPAKIEIVKPTITGSDAWNDSSWVSKPYSVGDSSGASLRFEHRTSNIEGKKETPHFDVQCSMFMIPYRSLCRCAITSSRRGASRMAR